MSDEFSPLSTSRLVNSVLKLVQTFFAENPHIGNSSHGLEHAKAVHHHAVQALQHLQRPPPEDVWEDIEIAALMHDLDDHKYFQQRSADTSTELKLHSKYPNTKKLLTKLSSPTLSLKRQNHILYLISLVSCSENGNSVPSDIQSSQAYHLLIPRWADRLESSGAIGVVRCYQYNQERNLKLSSTISPRPITEKEVWEFATPQRFQKYQERNGSSYDMISHYYDKLLHIARPPPEIVQNEYLERVAKLRVKNLLMVCLSFGRNGVVDEDYILELSKSSNCERQSCEAN